MASDRDRNPVDFKPPRSFRVKQYLRKVRRAILAPKIVHRDRLIVPDDEDRCRNPIFLLGMHRSGTTLVRRIMDAHHRIVCPPETFFLTAFARVLDVKRFADGLESMGFDREAAAKGLRRGADFFYETYRQSKGKPRWADKTPEYVRIMPLIEEMYGPECQYVMIFRHPFDVMNSLLSADWDFSMEQWDCMRYHDDRFTNVAMYHADYLQRQIDFEAERADRCHRMRYEDLVTDPEPTLRAVFEFLGEPWDPQVLEFHRKKQDKGIGDPHASVARGFEPSLNNWHAWTDEQIATARSILGAQLEQLGYDDASDAPGARATQPSQA